MSSGREAGWSRGGREQGKRGGNYSLLILIFLFARYGLWLLYSFSSSFSSHLIPPPLPTLPPTLLITLSLDLFYSIFCFPFFCILRRPLLLLHCGYFAHGMHYTYMLELL
ncbi:hypothetical protein P167DRAFT_296043 [Morchella conica CCBAS932]|uniref:Uncharacterized protein n=1 Tax=Morchella conica CCBAS932 TaxID=1392247 RepID=A0A3N4KMR0_9PEZI|nr:hypothetical protein P167DRAFT_296043 [Morchella conica CCBAS932]